MDYSYCKECNKDTPIEELEDGTELCADCLSPKEEAG